MIFDRIKRDGITRDLTRIYDSTKKVRVVVLEELKHCQGGEAETVWKENQPMSTNYRFLSQIKRGFSKR